LGWSFPALVRRSKGDPASRRELAEFKSFFDFAGPIDRLFCVIFGLARDLSARKPASDAASSDRTRANRPRLDGRRRRSREEFANFPC
jgi:hypothetical protein